MAARAEVRLLSGPPDSTLSVAANRITDGRVRDMLKDTVTENGGAEQLRDTVMGVEERNRQFYANLAERARSGGFSKWLHSMLIVTPRSQRREGEVIDETKIFAPYEGRVINEVQIETRPLFDRARSVLQKAMAAVHSPTWKYTIRRDLMFRVGDEIDPDLLVRNKQLLRSRRYIYDPQIIVTPDPQDSTAVIVKVITRDRWTIGADVGMGGITSGNMYADIYDYNFLGSGNRLRYRLTTNWKSDFYRGSFLQYTIPNMMKTFYQGDFMAGRTNDRIRFLGSINKKILMPTDYELGISGGLESYNIRDYGAIPQVQYHFTSVEMDTWFGKSFQVGPDESSYYVMGRYDFIRFDDRPFDTGPDTHPYFHNRQTALVSTGIFREEFLLANLIYGFGYGEYISRGFRFELTGGYSWEEFGSGWYAGMSGRMGGFTPVGYIVFDASAGSFLGFRGRDFYRSAINFDLTHFTDLLNIGPEGQLRHFLRISSTMGFNRGEGVGESLRFNTRIGPRFYRTGNILGGRNRLVLSSETVIFTPWIPVGFRLAPFVFADVGWLGDSYNFFKNDHYAVVGFGIRLRNEMLVFSAIEISFSIFFDKYGLRSSSPVRLGGEKHFQSYRFTPDKPLVVEYR